MDPRSFLENYQVTDIEKDPLPIKVLRNAITKEEIPGQAVHWGFDYLDQRSCPLTLISHILEKLYQEVHQTDFSHCAEGADDALDGSGSVDHEMRYEPLKLMRAIVKKLDEICIKEKEDYHDSVDGIVESPDMLPHVFAVSYNNIKNSRRFMEDRMTVLPRMDRLFKLPSPISYFAVFDGHNGSEAAAYGAAQMHQYLIQGMNQHQDIIPSILDAFENLDEAFIQKCRNGKVKSGSTVVLSLIMSEKLYVAWLGDSQAVLVRNNEVNNLVSPHKPERKDEYDRIKSLGGEVIQMHDTYRVNGNLAVSRAIGDSEQKTFIISTPDIKMLELDGSEEFLILACDGLWDEISPEAAAQIVRRQVVADPTKVPAISQKLVQQAKAKGSQDNISVIVVFLQPVESIKNRYEGVLEPEVESDVTIFKQSPEPIDAMPMEKFIEHGVDGRMPILAEMNGHAKEGDQQIDFLSFGSSKESGPQIIGDDVGNQLCDGDVIMKKEVEELSDAESDDEWQFEKPGNQTANLDETAIWQQQAQHVEPTEKFEQEPGNQTLNDDTNIWQQQVQPVEPTEKLEQEHGNQTLNLDETNVWQQQEQQVEPTDKFEQEPLIDNLIESGSNALNVEQIQSDVPLDDFTLKAIPDTISDDSVHSENSFEVLMPSKNEEFASQVDSFGQLGSGSTNPFVLEDQDMAAMNQQFADLNTEMKIEEPNFQLGGELKTGVLLVEEQNNSTLEEAIKPTDIETEPMKLETPVTEASAPVDSNAESQSSINPEGLLEPEVESELTLFKETLEPVGAIPVEKIIEHQFDEVMPILPEMNGNAKAGDQLVDFLSFGSSKESVPALTENDPGNQSCVDDVIIKKEVAELSVAESNNEWQFEKPGDQPLNLDETAVWQQQVQQVEPTEKFEQEPLIDDLIEAGSKALDVEQVQSHVPLDDFTCSLKAIPDTISDDTVHSENSFQVLMPSKNEEFVSQVESQGQLGSGSTNPFVIDDQDMIAMNQPFADQPIQPETNVEEPIIQIGEQLKTEDVVLVGEENKPTLEEVIPIKIKTESSSKPKTESKTGAKSAKSPMKPEAPVTKARAPAATTAASKSPTKPEASSKPGGLVNGKATGTVPRSAPKAPAGAAAKPTTTRTAPVAPTKTTAASRIGATATRTAPSKGINGVDSKPTTTSRPAPSSTMRTRPATAPGAPKPAPAKAPLPNTTSPKRVPPVGGPTATRAPAARPTPASSAPKAAGDNAAKPAAGLTRPRPKPAAASTATAKAGAVADVKKPSAPKPSTLSAKPTATTTRPPITRTVPTSARTVPPSKPASTLSRPAPARTALKAATDGSKATSTTSTRPARPAPAPTSKAPTATRKVESSALKSKKPSPTALGKADGTAKPIKSAIKKPAAANNEKAELIKQNGLSSNEGNESVKELNTVNGGGINGDLNGNHGETEKQDAVKENGVHLDDEPVEVTSAAPPMENLLG